MIDDQVNWTEGVDFLGITSQASHCVSHGCQINDCWNSSEILKDNSGRFEGDLDSFAGELFPVQDVLNIFGGDFKLIAVSDSTFEENSNAVG